MQYFLIGAGYGASFVALAWMDAPLLTFFIWGYVFGLDQRKITGS